MARGRDVDLAAQGSTRYTSIVSGTLIPPDLGSRANRRRWQADLVIAGAALFVLLTVAAMVAFPGGATFDIAARHYLFFDNYLSDLGATHTYSGRPNTASRVLFSGALVSVGIALALFGSTWKVWASRGRGRVLGAVASSAAALAGCSFIATAFTPWDRDYYTHTALVRAAFVLVFVFMTCLTNIQLRDHAPSRWIRANVVYVVALAIYVSITIFGPDVGTRHGLELQVATQKVIVGATMLNLSLQAWAVRSSAQGGQEYGQRSAAPPSDL